MRAECIPDTASHMFAAFGPVEARADERLARPCRGLDPQLAEPGMPSRRQLPGITYQADAAEFAGERDTETSCQVPVTGSAETQRLVTRRCCESRRGSEEPA